MTDHDSLIARVAAFCADHLAPAAPGWSMGAEVSPEILRKAGALSLFGLEVPKEAGGLGLGFSERVAVLQTLAAIDFGFAMSVVNTHNLALNVARQGTEAQKAQYLSALLRGEMSGCTALTEPGAGTDFGAITTRAEEVDGGWALTGEKTWIVNARHADLSLVFAQCGAAGDRDGIAAFLVDLNAPGVERFAIQSAFAQSSIGAGGFRLNGVRVESAAQLFPPGRAFKSILGEINAARAYVAAMCDAMLGAALADARAYGAERRSMGRPLNAYPNWRAPLDAAEAALAAARALTEAACQDVAAGADARLSAARAKVASVEAAQTHLPHLLHAMGAEGLRPARPFARHLAAAQIAGLTDGATLILKAQIARAEEV